MTCEMCKRYITGVVFWNKYCKDCGLSQSLLDSESHANIRRKIKLDWDNVRSARLIKELDKQRKLITLLKESYSTVKKHEK